MVDEAADLLSGCSDVIPPVCMKDGPDVDTSEFSAGK